MLLKYWKEHPKSINLNLKFIILHSLKSLRFNLNQTFESIKFQYGSQRRFLRNKQKVVQEVTS